MIFCRQDHFQNNNKYGGKNSPSHKNKRHLFSYKTLKNSSKTWKKLNFLSDIHNLSHIHQLSLTCLAIFRLISALYFIYAKYEILLLDPSPNENPNVSFVPHKTAKNTTTFLAFMKNFHLKWEEILKIDKWKVQKVLLAMKRNSNLFLKSNLINFRTHKKSCSY